MQILYEYYRLYAAEITFGLVIAAVILLLWVIILQIRLGMMSRRYKAAMQGAEGGNLESAIATLNRTIADQQQRLGGLEKRADSTEQTVAAHAGRVGVVRFNPFNDTGGDQSFTIAWLDSNTNGVVLSSLHNRAGTRVYAKPIVKGDSTHALTDEERQAIKNAITA